MRFSSFIHHQEGGRSVLEDRVSSGVPEITPEGHVCPSLYVGCWKRECVSEAFPR